MAILVLFVVGAAAGFIATRLMGKELGIAQTIALGVVGAVVGWVALRLFMALLGVAAGFVGAVLGTLIILWVWQKYFD